jgi:hypothetical protein
MLHSSLNPLSLTTSSGTLGGEELSQVPMLRLTPSIGVGAIGGDLLLDRLNRAVHEVAYEIIMI